MSRQDCKKGNHGSKYGIEMRSVDNRRDWKVRAVCLDCGTRVPDPAGCPHTLIRNDLRTCKECGEEMISLSMEHEYITSAPNLAACTIPYCDGGYGCQNPNGVYIPDTLHEKHTLYKTVMTYECNRCHLDGHTLFDGESVQYACSGSHHGDEIYYDSEGKVTT